jgi:beta-phosphoglucomutase
MIQGFIFDMDGTMVDNMMTHHRAWQIKLKELGLDWTIEQVKAEVHGINEQILERLFGDRFTSAERKRLSFEKEQRYRDVFLTELSTINGLTDFLTAAMAQNTPLSIGTAAPVENVDFVLDNLNLRSFFKGVIHAGMVEKGKPDPEVFEKAAASMGIPLKNCLIFEDSVVGAQAALNAGCPVVIVTTTHAREEFAAFPNVVKFIKDYTEIGVQETVQFMF